MKNHKRSATLILAVFLAATAGFAQETRATLTGRITDPSGAMVVNADVRVVNPETGAAVSGRSNQSGNYVLPYILPGSYRLTVELSGFKKFQRDGIQMRINDTVEVNVELTVGQVNESVVVSETTPLLETSTASLGQVVDTRRITELPLQAGNPFELVTLAPGVSNGTDLRLRKAGWTGAPSQFTTDGNRMYSNEFTIDGVTNTFSEGTTAKVAFSPPASSIAEVKVQTSSFDASLGHAAGAVINTITKSGTNSLHGELHHQFSNSALDANDFFNNRAGAPKATYQDNRYGFSAGGPMVLPKVYDGRNKSFFFYAHEANKWGVPGVEEMTVPTSEQRNGDFSKLLALGQDYQIYDPFSASIADDGSVTRRPVAGNIIPSSRIDSVAKNMAKFWPAPNLPGTADGQNNYSMSNKAVEDYYVHIARFDHNFNENHRMFVRVNYDWWAEDKNNYFHNESTGIVLNRINRGAALDDVIVLGSATILNLRYGFTQQDFLERRKSRGYDLASLGFSPKLTSLVDPALATFPLVEFDNYAGFGGWERGDGANTGMVHTFAGNVTAIRGSHNLRYGAEYRNYRKFAARYPYDVSPSFYFDTTYTLGPTDTDGSSPIGQDLASFLFGIPGGSMQRTASAAEQDQFFGMYFQDDWKVSRRLSINVGLRYEYESPITERFDRSVRGFDFNTANPIEAAARANYARNPVSQVLPSQFNVKGGLLFAGGNNGRGLWGGDRFNLMPRIGLAYTLSTKTVLRAGYGLFYDTLGVNRTAAIQSGFTQSTPMIASEDNGINFIASIANPFPAGLQQPVGAAGGLTTYLGQAISFYPTERNQPYSQRWSLGLQRQLPHEYLLEVSYVGNRGTRLPVAHNIAALPTQYLSRSSERDQATINYLSSKSPNPYYGLDPVYPQRINLSDLLRPYSQFTSVAQTQPDGYSWYHSMQTRLEKRFSHGYTMQVAHTWAKNMEAVEYLNAADSRPSEVISSLDRQHRLAASAIWELPFGKGRQFGSEMPRTLNAIAGGWQLNLVVQKQSGSPLGFGNAIFRGDLKDVPLSNNQRSADRWFNVDAGFERSSSKQLASNYRTFPLRFSGIHGPNQARWDLSAVKYFAITERFRLQLRAESFNALNHANFYNPSTSVTSSAFGSIDSQQPTPRSFQAALKLTF